MGPGAGPLWAFFVHAGVGFYHIWGLGGLTRLELLNFGFSYFCPACLLLAAPCCLLHLAACCFIAQHFAAHAPNLLGHVNLPATTAQ